MTMSTNPEDLWLEFLSVNELCGLCGQTGMIDTVKTGLRSPAGVPCGVRRPCICPNGRAISRFTSTVINIGLYNKDPGTKYVQNVIINVPWNHEQFNRHVRDYVYKHYHGWDVIGYSLVEVLYEP